MRKTFKQKLISSLLALFLIFQLTAGIFLPLQISFNPPEIKIQQAQAAGENWYNSSYQYRRAITLNNSQITANQTNFPVLATTTADYLKHTDYSGGKVGNVNGYDIVFTDDDGSTLLNYEKEKYASTTGEIVYWINTDVSSTTDKTIYMYYGNASASDQATTTGVWDDNFKMVQHMNEDPSSSAPQIIDSTSNDNDGTSVGSMTSGDLVSSKVGDGLDLDGTNDCIDLGFNNNYTSEVTLSAWIYYRSSDTNIGEIISKRSYYATSPTDFPIFLYTQNADDKVYARLSKGDDYSADSGLNSVSALTKNAWHYVCMTYKANDSHKLYVDNAAELSNSIDFTINADTRNWFTGRASYEYGDGAGTNNLNAIIDEVRISDTARSAQWIETEYNNQVSVGNFMAYGAEEGLGTLTLAEHTAGQENDAFLENGAETNAELYAFKLTNTNENINVTNLIFSLSNTAGLVNGDWAGVEIIKDDNNNGTIDVGETTAVGGSGAVDMAGGTITFSTQFTASSATNYILRADFASLSGEDKADINLTSGNITAIGVDTGENITPAGSCSNSSHVEANWYNSSYQYRRAITLNNSQITANQTNFPVLATTTADYLKHTDYSGGKVGNVNGYDIVFTDDDGSTLLNYEKEKYASTTGEIVYWINTDVSSTTDKTIYMYYGNASASDQATTTGVWDDNFKMVQHLQETPACTTYDSTSYGNNGATSGMDSADQVAGQVDGSFDFDGGSDHIGMGDPASLEPSHLTLSFWMKTDDYTESLNGGVAKGYIFGSGTEFAYKVDFHNGNAKGSVSDNSNTHCHTENVGINDNNWHLWIFVYDGSNIILYKDGSSGSSNGFTGNIDYTKLYDNFLIGARDDGLYSLNGKLDEVRISNTARSAQWIETEYNNQVSVGNFMAYGTEKSLKLDITTAAKTLTAGAESDAYTVQAQNSDGNSINVSGDTTINLASDSSGTYQFAANLGGASVNSVTISSGSNSTNFYYTDQKVGTPLITVSGTNFTQDTQQQTINPASPNNLNFIQQPSNTVAESAISPAITVQTRDQYNNICTNDNSTSVSMAINNNPGSGSLSGAIPQTVSSGIATFNDLSCKIY